MRFICTVGRGIANLGVRQLLPLQEKVCKSMVPKEGNK